MSQKNQEVTLCVLKPDAYERKIVNSIINDIQSQGFEVTPVKCRRCSGIVL